MSVAPDHLVLGAATLEAGVEFVRRTFGVAPQPGGKHERMGTHNALLKLGERVYLEIIAIDPHGNTPFQPRWFGLDDPATQQRLAQGPKLLGWIVRTDDIAAAVTAARIDAPIHAVRRGAFAWRMTIPADGLPAGGGLIPAVIQWDVAVHPCEQMAESGCVLRRLKGAHPEPEAVGSVLRALGVSDCIELVRGDAPPLLLAEIETPRALVQLASR